MKFSFYGLIIRNLFRVFAYCTSYSWKFSRWKKRIRFRRFSRSSLYRSLSTSTRKRDAKRGDSALRKNIFFFCMRWKFLTPINHDYSTEASPELGQYILLTKSHVGSRANFFARLPGITFLNGFYVLNSNAEFGSHTCTLLCGPRCLPLYGYFHLEWTSYSWE